jgi:3-hydroxyisobutyrate dehydrogenase-like beta-hydroxyacid dehydrogenase
MAISTIGMIGYGEVGKIFTQDLREKTGEQGMWAWDIKFASAAAGKAEIAHAAQAGTRCADGMEELCAHADLIISAVTASSTLAVAEEAARHIRPGTLFLDLNSASPDTKRRASKAIGNAGAHYVEAGVMTSVPPYRIAVPMLLGGEKAEELAETLRGWGMNARPVAVDIGIASAIKMCRSIMIKGLEAIVIESYSTARFYGVEEHMLPTLAETFPEIDWPTQGAYFFSRVVQHGKRRAEEMREAANTVDEAGFPSMMAAATAQKQDWVAALAREGVFDGIGKNAPWQEYADRLIRKQEQK